MKKLIQLLFVTALLITTGLTVRAEEPVKLGVLHSLSGTMAISEVSLRDVVLMAIDEINTDGGILGKKIEPVVVDPASDWDLFAYTGATPNQQLIPAAEYLMSEDGGNYKKFYLLGTDYVFPRTANKILRAFLLHKGVPEENIMEEYTPFHHQDYQTIVQKIKRFAADGDAAILSTINGDSNVPFYKEFTAWFKIG